MKHIIDFIVKYQQKRKRIRVSKLVPKSPTDTVNIR